MVGQPVERFGRQRRGLFVECRSGNRRLSYITQKHSGLLSGRPLAGLLAVVLLTCTLSGHLELWTRTMGRLKKQPNGGQSECIEVKKKQGVIGEHSGQGLPMAVAPSISSVPSGSERPEPRIGERPFSKFTSSLIAGQEPSTHEVKEIRVIRQKGGNQILYTGNANRDSQIRTRYMSYYSL